MIVVDTGGMLALLDRSDKHHRSVASLFRERGDEWILPWAILPEVDYLAESRLGSAASRAFVDDLSEGSFTVDAEFRRDISRAKELLDSYSDLHFGLVDAVVMAQAERHRASMIVTMDARDFRAVRFALPTQPRLFPLDR